MKRIVVTGMGAVCSHGINPDAIFRSIVNGDEHIVPIDERTHFDSELYPQAKGRKVAAVQLTNEELMQYIDPNDRKLRSYDRHQLFAQIVAEQVLHTLGDQHDSINKARFGIVGATGDGGLGTGFESALLLLAGKKLSPFANLGELPNIFVGQIANRYGLKGPSTVHVTACAASAHAIMQAADDIKLGYADLMLAIGAEAAITPFGISSFASQRALGTDSRPYQTGRDGFIMGEGSAGLLLEDLDHARRRNAPILAELAGYGKTTDGVQGGAITAPDMSGGLRAAESALHMAAVFGSSIDYTNTHGTGTGADPIELDGAKTWAREHAPSMLLSSTKSWHGHLLGAAGALEAVLSIMMMREGLVLPTRGLTIDNLDPTCTGVDHVMGKPRRKDLSYVLSNSFGFGGTNASLVFTKYNG